MTRYAIGDVQGCFEELRELLERLNFKPDRDRLFFVGDLVNRGPASLQVLRLVHDLGDNATVVLGNHDLHLLAVAHGKRRSRGNDTIADVLSAPDREKLTEWLLMRPMAHAEAGPQGQTDVLIHAGLVPQWNVATTLRLAREVESALRADAVAVFEQMYGDEPDTWREDLAGIERLRFTINVLTRLRVCTADGRVDLKWKGKPPPPRSLYRPWFDVEQRESRSARVVFGHWSALGFVRRDGVVGLDSGCVWGGSLTAFDLDEERPPIAVPCGGYQVPDD